MSDFDKEAEREKLRKKYERDAEERKATQRMSDLLLKGATMTNSHCGTCGDPLFQQEGTTFCPSCHGNPDAVQGTGLEAQPAEGSVDESTPERDTAGGAETEAGTGAETADASAADSVGGEASSESSQSQSADSSAGDSSTDESAATLDVDAPSSSRDAAPSSSSSRETRSAAERARAPSESAARDASDGSSDERRSSERRGSARSSAPAAGDLETAHDSLVRALEKFAEKAAATDDPRYAKECLEAAREAGEALETLR